MKEKEYEPGRYFEEARLDSRGRARLAEEEVRRRIAIWRENPHDMSAYDRVFTLYGHPGVGVSWFLTHLAHENKVAVLEMRRAYDVDTPDMFVSETKNMVSVNKRGLIILDHVPSSKEAIEGHRALEEEVLIPALDRGSFLLMAQQDENSWAWRKLPHPSLYILRGFLAEQRGALYQHMFQQAFSEDAYSKFLFGVQEVYPLLMLFWGEEKKKNASSDKKMLDESVGKFLIYWLKEKNIDEDDLQHEDFIYLAACLTWLETLVDSTSFNRIVTLFNQLLGRQIDIDSLRMRFLLNRCGWTAGYDVWEEPLRTILQTWLKVQKPDLVQRLSRELGG